MLEDVRSVLRGGAPAHAIELDGGVDRAASTHHVTVVISEATASPPVETQADSAEIPIYLSGFSGIFDAASTDREPSPRGEPSAPSPPLETTLISPAGPPPARDPAATKPKG